jgi:hypothetical protein
MSLLHRLMVAADAPARETDDAEKGDRRRDADAARRRDAAAADAEAVAAEGEKPARRRRLFRRGGARSLSEQSGEADAQRSSDASCTIHRTNSPKSMPA